MISIGTAYRMLVGSSHAAHHTIVRLTRDAWANGSNPIRVQIRVQGEVDLECQGEAPRSRLFISQRRLGRLGGPAPGVLAPTGA
jgi:hypothetical protein